MAATAMAATAMAATALVVAAPGSGHGKTLVCAGLAKALLQQGKEVVLYKMGPDYLDPMFYRRATGLQVRQLDYWMLGTEEIAAELSRAADQYDHILIEGVMGLFDGPHPVAQLAREFQLPVVVVADASAMAQTFGALMLGLASYDDDVSVAAVIANKVGSDGHGEMLAPSLPDSIDYLGWIPRDERLEIPERHLGINPDAESVCRQAAEAMAEKLEHMLPQLPWRPPHFKSSHRSVGPGTAVPLAGKRVAIACDDAFSFIYPGNIDWFGRVGAEVEFFSPLADQPLPDCEVLYLPGGYPELFLQRLSSNRRSAESVSQYIESGGNCLAECGGMLYLLQALTYGELSLPMLGLLPGEAHMQSRLAGIGYQQLPESSLRGHSFHYAATLNTEPVAHAHRHDGAGGEAIYRYKNTLASFVHWYFASDTDRMVRWFQSELREFDGL